MIYAAITAAVVAGFVRYLRWRASRRGDLLGSPVPAWRDRAKTGIRRATAYIVFVLAAVPAFVLIGHLRT